MKKLIPTRPSPAMVVALIALFVALGGSAFALGRGSVGARSLAPLHLRSGRIVDTDTTAGDGNFNIATGHAQCKHGERLISGGLRLRGLGGVFPGQHASIVESGPVPKERRWAVTINSDLGGAARSDFVVFAYCLGQ